MTLLDGPTLLIIAAVGTYVLGFLFRDQIYIRLLVVIGSVLYAIYYMIIAPTPLWDAILGSALIGAASFQGMVYLYWSRMPLAVPTRDRHIFERFGEIEPGLFRSLMKAANREDMTRDVQMTIEGERPEKLWFLVQGDLVITRAGQPDAVLSGEGFVGEIAWLTKGKASAGAVARAGAEVISWDVDVLNKATRKSARLQLALEAVVAQDLARKLAKSRPIEVSDVPIPVLVQAE